jgi:signal peptidase I
MTNPTTSRRGLSLLGGAFTMLLLLAWIVLLRPSSLGGPATYTVVSGDSMKPAFENGDYVITFAEDGYSDGDVIAFSTDGGLVLHRVVGGSPQEGFITRGDNNTGVDPWRPQGHDVLGAVGIRIPRAGTVVAAIQRPAGIGLVAGLVTTLMMLMSENSRRRRKRPSLPSDRITFARSGGDHELRSNLVGGAGRSTTWAGSRWVAATLAVLTVSVAILTFQAFRLSSTETLSVDAVEYVHEGTFVYTAAVETSTVYQSSTVGPVTEATKGSMPPLYTRLVDSIEIDFSYSFVTDSVAEVDGTVAAEILVQAGEDGWVRSMPAPDPQPLRNGVAELSIPIDVDSLVAMISAAEEETGHTPGTYRVSVTPVVDVRGGVDGHTIGEQFSPSFDLDVSAGRIDVVSELTPTRSTTVSSTVDVPTRVALPFGTIEVGHLRWMSAVGLIVVLVAATVLLMRSQQWQRLRKRLLYGSMIVPVAHFDIADDRKRIAVPSMSDLVRLAKASGGVVLRQESPPGVFTYAVSAEDAVYEYAEARRT